jgi:hypothetical protein
VMTNVSCWRLQCPRLASVGKPHNVFREEETAFMVAKKKAKKKPTKSGQATRHKMAPRKKTTKKKLAIKGRTSRKQSAKKTTHKKVTAKAVGKKSKSTRPRPVRRRSQTAERVGFSPTRSITGSAGQSGDLQGLSDVEVADSESVDELLEEGNAFEADVVSGVEKAGDTPREVRTHEVPEDDVPGEYLDSK